MLNLSDANQFFGRTPPFSLRKLPKNAKFSGFLRLREPFVATFSKSVYPLPENMFLRQT